MARRERAHSFLKVSNTAQHFLEVSKTAESNARRATGAFTAFCTSVDTSLNPIQGIACEATRA
eukprot:9759692-Alexandrium_andersonii.AAC.1